MAGARRYTAQASASALLVALALACGAPGRRAVTPPVGVPTEGGAEAAAETAGGDHRAGEPELVAPVEPLSPVDTPAAGLEVLAVTEAEVPLLLRVGLLTDEEEVVLRCCGRLWVERDGKRYAARTPLTVRPAAAATVRSVFRLQVAALRDEHQATELAGRLRRSSGEPADATLDAETGLHRVRLGRWPDREAAERARRGLVPRLVPSAWVVSEGGELRDPAMTVTQGASTVRVPGRWLVVGTDSDAGIGVGDRRFRGRIAFFLNDRGSLNVVNELSLESYLRGVVPREMGPAEYPEIEALKALAVAARTYTVHNLWEFDAEGFDICGTPRCQVYGGMGAEHPRSDRAIAETAGEILWWRSRPIDALYSSTCAGHTEDVATVFPLKADEVYLKGVPCLEGGVEHLSPRVAPGVSLDRVIAASTAATETARDGRPGGAAGGPSGGLEPARFLGLDGEHLVVGNGGGTVRRLPLEGVAALRRGADGSVVSAALTLAPGDPLDLYWESGRLLGVLQPGEPRAVTGLPSKYRSWSRFRTDRAMAAAVRQRFPGFDLRALKVVSRGVSGRVGALQVTATDGRTALIEGLDVRWALDLPDTLFEVERVGPPGSGGWRFTGRGWGHGVGLCQIGSYGMALRGHDYREILMHYYTGVELGRVSALERRVVSRSE